MLSVNSPILFRTNGRGVTRTLKGIVFGIVKAGMTLKTNQLKASLPHGDKPSNRDRYIVKLDKTGVLVWANVATAVAGNEKLPAHRPRLSAKPKAAKKVKAKPVAKAKAVAKAKVKPVAKVKPRSQMTPKEKSVAAGEPQMPKVKADKPKTTWYGIVDGKVVSVRKVVCPEGFSKTKPMIPDLSVFKKPLATTPIPAETPAPAPEAAALPQAAV